VSLDSATIDRIVSGIMHQISGGEIASRGTGSNGIIIKARRDGESSDKSSEVAKAGSIGLSAKVITADVLEEIANGSSVRVGEKAIVTPAAWDAAKERGLRIERGTVSQDKLNEPGGSTSAGQSKRESATAIPSNLLIVVHHTDAIDRLRDDLDCSWQRELIGCPDDAAKLAISELSRGGVASVVIFAEQAHRAACLANRHDKVKAVTARDALDVKSARQQLKVNTWCIDPSGRSWFELRNIIKAISH